METDFRLEGAEDLQETLLALPIELQKAALVDSFMAGGEIVAGEARAQAQAQGIDVFDDEQEAYRDERRKLRHKGQFWESIIVVPTNARMKRQVGTSSVVQVAVKKGFSRLAHFFEYGTGPRKRKGGGSTGHIEARPFMRPAADQAGPRAVQEIARRLGVNIEIIVNQLRRRHTGGRGRRRQK